MSKPFYGGLGAVLLVATIAANLRAQDTLLEELYGQGVHAFFAGHDFYAIEKFDAALGAGSRDPRVYYFRALALDRMGRMFEAKASFMRGAELEAAGGDRIYPVNRSLQRIQGYQRMVLEKFRLQARLDAHLRRMGAAGARYEELERAEGEVLRNPTPRRATPAAPPAGGAPPTNDPTDPFSSGAPSQPTPSGPTQPSPADPADPFGTGGPGTMPADPFGPSTTPPPSAPGAGDTTDPFGDDPFGGGAAPPAGAAPGGAAPDPFGADPFGGGGAAPPAGNPPAGGAADPFGGGADPGDADVDPFADDPFGT